MKTLKPITWSKELMQDLHDKTNIYSFTTSVDELSRYIKSQGGTPDYESLKSSWLQRYIELIPELYKHLTTKIQLIAYITNATNQEYIQNAQNKLFLMG